VHPGEVLDEEFLKPLGLTQYRLAKGLKVPGRRINEIVLGKRAISADTALRLARFFRSKPTASVSSWRGM
jgi:addiction module HigA family antidote